MNLIAYDSDARPNGRQLPTLSHTPIQQSSAGPEAVDLAAAAGLYLDPWQRWCVEHILGERHDETYYNEVLDQQMYRSSAYESAVVVARQNGKGSILECVELAWLYLLGARTIIHSAHEFATSREHFQRMESLITRTPELKKELAPGGIKWSHGDESITLKTGQRLLFKTRTRGAARGFSPDKIVMDEAMILKQDAVSAMTYAMSARPDPQLIYTGSAGDKDSEHFGRARARGMAGTNADDLFFAEWSAEVCTVFCDKDCQEHDDPRSPYVWAKANPALGYRIQHRGVRSELNRDPVGFLRERLSVGDWPVDGDEWKIISKELWEARVDESSYVKGGFVLAIDTAPDSSFTCLSIAGENIDGMMHVEISSDVAAYDYRSSTRWVVDRVKEIWKKSKPLAVALDKTSQAGMFVKELEEAGIRVIYPNSAEYAQACGDFYTSVVPSKEHVPNLVHLGQEPLTSALAGADKRDLAGSWAWHKRNSSVDISPLVASTLAIWGYQFIKHEPKASPPWVVRR